MPGSAHTWVDGDVATAAFLNAIPRGIMGYTPKTSAQGSIVAIIDIAGLSVAFTAISSRYYRTRVECYCFSSVANDIAAVIIADATNVQIESSNVTCTSTSLGMKVAFEVVETGLSGAITRKARVARAAGSGNITVDAAASFPAFIIVEDIGV